MAHRLYQKRCIFEAVTYFFLKFFPVVLHKFHFFKKLSRSTAAGSYDHILFILSRITLFRSASIKLMLWPMAIVNDSAFELPWHFITSDRRPKRGAAPYLFTSNVLSFSLNSPFMSIAPIFVFAFVIKVSFMTLSKVEATPSYILSTRLPAKPSATITSALPFETSLPSILPIKLISSLSFKRV